MVFDVRGCGEGLSRVLVGQSLVLWFHVRSAAVLAMCLHMFCHRMSIYIREPADTSSTWCMEGNDRQLLLFWLRATREAGGTDNSVGSTVKVCSCVCVCVCVRVRVRGVSCSFLDFRGDCLGMSTVVFEPFRVIDVDSQVW